MKLTGFRLRVGLGTVTLSVSLAALSLGPSNDASARPWPGKPGHGNFEDGTWQVLRLFGERPIGRSAPAVAAQGRWVYMFGGSHDDVVTGEVTLFEDFYRFDTARNRWHALSPEGTGPSARAFVPMVNDAESGQLLIYGGASFGDFFGDFEALGDLWSYDPNANQWTELSLDGAGPGGRSGAGLWMSDGKLYVFGGIDSFFQTHNDLWTYDLDSAQWQQLIADGDADSPPPRHEPLLGTSARRGTVTIYGGETVAEDFSFITLDDTWQYDNEQGTWQEVTPAPQDNIDPPRNFGAASQIRGSLYVHGGDIPGGEECGAVFLQNPTDELWRFDLKTERWNQLSPRGFPVARLKRNRAANVRGAMYVFGGYDFACVDGEGLQEWNTNVYRYRP